jgi:hypothetical protein
MSASKDSRDHDKPVGNLLYGQRYLVLGCSIDLS